MSREVDADNLNVLEPWSRELPPPSKAYPRLRMPGSRPAACARNQQLIGKNRQLMSFSGNSATMASVHVHEIGDSRRTSPSGVAVRTLVPVPLLDGWVIWRIVIHSRRDDAASPWGE